MTKTIRVICVLIVPAAAVLAACSSSSGRAVPPPATTSSSTSPTTVVGPPTPAATLAARDSLEFREVLGTFPNSGSTTSSANSCQNGTTASTTAPAPPSAPLVLPDPAGKTCYLLGPTLLSGRDLASASVATDPASAKPEVDLHFAGDTLASKIEGPMVGQQVAIVFEGVVESAPNIDPGTGDEIAISGNLTQATASAIAQKLS